MSNSTTLTPIVEYNPKSRNNNKPPTAIMSSSTVSMQTPKGKSMNAKKVLFSKPINARSK
jgi:hypothetical protein